MPPVTSRPLQEEAQTVKPEVGPAPNFFESLDLSDIITNAVTSLKLQSDKKKNKPKRKYKFPFGICEKVSIRTRNLFTVTIVDFFYT